MTDNQARLTAIFEDTRRFWQEDAALATALKDSLKGTVLYGADDYPPLPAQGPTRHGEVRVTRRRTFEAATALRREFPDKKIAVLNFASAIRPGGGVTWGCTAQEECLCRCSTLYATLDQPWLWRDYYGANRARGDRRNTDACIYSPGVVICKTDERFPERLPREDFATVDVITCAAPDLREEPADWRDSEAGRERLYALHLSRTRHILHVAAVNGADLLVLGAFGCGAFRNDPDVVSSAIQAALPDYLGYFDAVEFAIYCGAGDTPNFTAFNRRFG